ncbi:hypothetical protein [Streptomyces sp. SJL17-1]|uniref:hypothetical protein n=1 Tax=Streptomyces sp. SJL17-1 TaxID=2967223 RepID=UPI002966ACE1|nr:hypothetical protein [Streptomyces sp. SJL17-1]
MKDEDIARPSRLKDRHINIYLDDFWAGDGLLVEASRSQHVGDQAPLGLIGNGLSSVDEVAVHVVGPGTERFEVAMQRLVLPTTCRGLGFLAELSDV